MNSNLFSIIVFSSSYFGLALVTKKAKTTIVGATILAIFWTYVINKTGFLY